MEETLYIVVYRYTATEVWREKTSGVFNDKRLAENFVEILEAQKFAPFIAIVSGPITCPEQMAEAEAALGAF
jgi:hypothetical protein